MYYGLSLNSSNLGGDDYLNFFIAGAVEIPAYAVCLVSFMKIGRRWPLAGVMVVAGLALMATAPVPDGKGLSVYKVE